MLSFFSVSCSSSLFFSPEKRHGFRHGFHDFICLFRHIISAERNPQRTVSHIVRNADGQKYVAGVHRTGGTRRSGRCRYSHKIKLKQKGFPVDIFKRDIDGSRQPVFFVSVEPRSGDLQKSLLNSVPHGRQPLCLFFPGYHTLLS